MVEGEGGDEEERDGRWSIVLLIIEKGSVKIRKSPTC